MQSFFLKKPLLKRLRHACGKVIFAAEKEAFKIADSMSQKMWVHECTLPVYHLTSRCPKCSCRKVYHRREDAVIGGVCHYIETGKPPFAITKCKCGLYKSV